MLRKGAFKNLKSKSMAERGAVVGDAARSKVPLSRRLVFWNNSFILWGWVLVLSSFMIGGLVGQAFPLKMSMPIIFFGTLGGTIGPVIAGTIFDQTKSYSMAFLLLTGMAVLGLILTSQLRPTLPNVSDASTVE